MALDEMNRHRLPKFSLAEYDTLLDSLRDAGYVFCPVSEMPNPVERKTAYLRHDIDMHIVGIERIAEIETAHGAKSTYYILMTQHYNPMQADNHKILRQLVTLGHEIGLHYDLEMYPADLESAHARLRWETGVLAQIADAPVRTIAMHQPHKGFLDPFRMQDEFVHPGDPRYQQNLVYISDSCRAWRDESLLNCFGPNAPQRLLLTIHPELWLDGTVTERMSYLQVLIVNATYPYRNYFDIAVRQIWRDHPGPRLHDERERGQTETP